MPESRGRPVHRQPIPPLPSQPTKPDLATHRLRRGLFGRLYRAAPSFIVWASVIVTLVSGFYLLPRVTVDPLGPYDPANPSPVIFTIANINIVPLSDVQPWIGICYINTNEVPDCNGPITGGLIYGPWHIAWLDVDEKYQIALEEALRLSNNSPKQFESADITISITYTPWRLWFLRTTREFRFVTKRRSDGKIYWTPVPLNR
jgi:hypothetical protein